MKWWFTADLHLGHANIIELCERPFKNIEEMDAALIDNWNSVVDGADTVVVAGDLTLGHDYERVRYLYLRHLKGNVILVKGNHDHYLRTAEQKRYMYNRKINGRAVYVSHYALRSWPGMNKRDSWNLHGHSHGTLEPLPNQLDVGVDVHNFYPVHYDQVEEQIKEWAKRRDSQSELIRTTSGNPEENPSGRE